MTAKFIPYGRQTVTDEDIAAVVEVLKSDYLTQGPEVELFEQAVAERVTCNHAVASCNATSSLHLACLSLGLKEGDLLWTSPTTFVASANCGFYCKADVDFVDIDPSTGLMSVRELEKRLVLGEKEGRLPKVVIPVHLCGSSCDMKRIKELGNRYGFKIIEDASHALGGEYRGQPVGSCLYSDITVFSFHPVKIVTSGEGGMATTNSHELAKTMRHLRSHGITKEPSDFREREVGQWHYEQQSLGYNYRITDIQAALGRSQLKRLDAIIRERREILNTYVELTRDLPIKTLRIPPDVKPSVHLVVIRLDNKEPAHHRRVFEGLRKAGIGAQLHYSPVHLQPYYRSYGFRRGNFPNAEEYGQNAISLPVYPGLEKDDIMRIVKNLAGLVC